MMHSQLKVRYPTSPFMWDYNDMTETFRYRSDESTRSKVIREIIDNVYANQRDPMTRTDESHDYEVVRFITEMTSGNLDRSADSMDTNHHFYSIIQDIPRSKLGKHIWINFHTTAYRMKKNTYISAEFRGEFEWCLIPMIGQIQKVIPSNSMLRKNARALGRDIVKVNEKLTEINPLDFNPEERERNMTKDRAYGTEVQDIRNHRVRNRGFVRRTVVNVEGSAPDYFEFMRRTVVNVEGSAPDYFEFMKDRVAVHKVNGIFRFSPISSGRVRFIVNGDETLFKFITVMRFGLTIHITFHTINVV